MNQSILLRIAFSGFLLMGILACGSEPQEEESPNQLLGRWDIRQAMRNGQPTESLDDLYFEFFQDGKMSTNLNNGTIENASYEVEGNTIRQRESQFPVDYTIEEVNDSILVLSTEIRNYKFKFLLDKTIQEE